MQLMLSGSVPATVFQAVFECSRVGELLLSATEDPRILAANEAYLNLTGCQREALLGRHFFEVLAGAADDFSPALCQSLQRVRATGEPDTLTVHCQALDAPESEDRSEDRRARSWRLTSTPIFSQAHELVCIALRTEDVTEAWRLQETLRLNAERETFQLRLSDRMRPLEKPEEVVAVATQMLGEYLGVSRVAYAEVDAQQATFFVRSHWTGQGLESITGEVRRLDDFGPGIIQLLKAGKPMVVADVNRDKRTRGHAQAYAAIDVQANLAIPVLKGGKLKTVLSVQHKEARPWTPAEIELVTEVAERTWSAAENARAQQALRDAGQRKDEFLAMLAHELRNPLAPISVAAQLLARQQLDPAGLRKTGEVIGRQVKHMTGLVDDLLDVSRVTRGLVRIDEAPQELKLIVAGAVEQTRPLLESQKHELSLRLPDEPVSVLGDGKRLVQIVANLINNAAKYTPPGGHVEVAIDLQADCVRLHVRDDGMGIPKDLQVRIFDLFAQGERTRDRSQGGLGIGLALVKSLVELHHGTVSCFSEGPGRGSVFTVILPRLQASRL